jgi:hypothetical protein
MFTFKDYLTESKKTYSFRVKVCGDLPKDFSKQVKDALAKYDPCNVGTVKRTPIQETPLDFPNKKNMAVSIFDVEVNYPANSPAISAVLSDCLNCGLDCIIVRTPAEEAEMIMNMAHMKVPGDGEALLGKDYETNAEAQKVVGQVHVSNFLKELEKLNAERKKEFTKTEKTEKVESTDPDFETPKDSNNSPLGNIKNPDPRQGKTK